MELVPKPFQVEILHEEPIQLILDTFWNYSEPPFDILISEITGFSDFIRGFQLWNEIDRTC